ncbi:MAG: hypothetical protein ACOX9R_11135 [Armatimonadota bacterium]|jgi:hypothetical protein
MRNALVLIMAVALLAASSPALLAQDDAQMTHDELVEYLGVHPDFEEYLHEVPLDVGERRNESPHPQRLLVGHVAENRFVIKVEFAEDYPRENVVLHIYADIDDDETTGREGSTSYNGTDMMYSFVDARNDPRFFNRDVRAYQHYPVRGTVVGNAVYVCDDLHPNVVDGQTHFRLRLLSHLRSEAGVSHSTSWAYVNVPLSADRELPRLPMPEAAGFGHLTMPNFAELSHSIWQAEGTVRLRPDDAEITGFIPLMNDDFDGVGAEGESVRWRSPVAGSYHVGLVLSGGPEGLQRTRRTLQAREEAGERPDSTFGISGVDVLVGGETIGTVVGHDGSGQVVHFSEEPVALERGTPIEVRSAEHSGAVVFSDVHLTREPPTVPPLHVENLSAWHLPDEPGEVPGRIMVAWTTNRPTTATVSYRTTPQGQSGELEGRGLVNSHYVMLPTDVAGDVWQLEIDCAEADQQDFQAQRTSAQYTVHRDRAAHLTAHGEPAAVSGERLSINLSVAEPTGAARTNWPVRSGVPLPEGVLSDPSAVRLLDATGAEVPVQTQATSWWPDGLSVRWLLVDFAATTTAGEPAQYTLEVNAQPAMSPEQPVTVTAGAPEGDGPHPIGLATAPIEVNTGPLTWRLSEGGFAPFADVTVNGRQAPPPAAGAGGFELTDAEGRLFSSALEAPEEILVEQSGPQRATLRVAGRLVNEDGEAYMRYLCRLHFHAGSPAVRTVFTLENDAFEPDMNLIESLRLTVPAEIADAQLSVGGDGEALAMAADGRLLQDEDFRFTLGDHEGHRADGWLLVAGQDGSLAVAVRDFWQLYPKGFSASADGVTLELLPALPEDIYADADEDALTQWYFWADGGRYKFRSGIRLSTEFAVDYAAQIEAGSPARYQAGDWWSEPLFAACTPEHYSNTGVLDTIIPRHEDRFERYERSLDSAFADFAARRESEREFGFINYGDWFGERTWNWGNNEYDTTWSLAVNFLRTGNREMLDQAIISAAHSADVDTIHHASDPNRIGYQYTHCIGHTAMYFPSDWKGMGGFNTHSGQRGGHIWSQGLFTAYALTGEERLLESGRTITDMLAHYTTDFRYGAERTVGWPMVAVVSGYEFDANPFYLNGAKLMADIVIWSQHPERGLWGHWIDGNECDHAPRCWGSKPFMTGVLLRALKMYDLAQPREDTRETLHDSVAFLFGEMFVEEGERPGFVYSSCRNPNYSQTGSSGRLSLIGPGLAYSVLIDPEQRHREMLEYAADLYFNRSGVSSFGKSFTQGTCFLPTVMHDLAELGISEFPAEPLHGEMELRVPGAPLEVGEWAEAVAVLRAPRDRPVTGLVRLEPAEGMTVEPETLRLTADEGRLGEAPFRLRLGALTGFDAYAGAQPMRARFLGDGLDVQARLYVGVRTDPLGEDLVVQAADFIEEEGGEVQVREDKVGHVGTSISHWDDRGHRLTWEIEAPRDGDYLLVLRYCTGSDVQRRVEVHGVRTIDQRFPGTGGWAATTDDWQHRALLENDGGPVVLNLRAGTYRVTMTNLCGNGMNLDYLALLPFGVGD